MLVRTRKIRSSAVCFAIAVALLCAGCASKALRVVHTTYQSEFQAELTGASDGADAKGALNPSDSTRYPATLSAIATFRSEYPDQADALKHVAVLEALVYLQTKQYGLARLAAENAARSAGNLTTFGGGLIRDHLLLDAMMVDPGLIDAWEMLEPGRNPPGMNNEKLGDVATNLSELTGQQAALEGDDGALYVAAVAALVYLKLMNREESVLVSQGNDPTPIKNKYGKLVVDVLEPHLTDVEKRGNDEELAKLASWSARYRYARLYKIGQRLENAIAAP